MGWMNGKKRYIGMIAMGVIGLLWKLSVIDANVAQVLELAAGTFFGVGVIHAQKKRDS